MRVTAQAKERTRDKILRVSCKLFVDNGFYEATTRDIACRARIAVGTLFNYFPSKEALGMTLVADALESAGETFQTHRHGGETLNELLFAHVMSGLRGLAAHRAFVGAVLESALSPFTPGGDGSAGDRLRAKHLETVAELISDDNPAIAPSFVAMHLYWTLYLGVLAFWSSDESPNQEDTLVVLDQSLRLFVQALATNNQLADGSKPSPQDYNSKSKEVFDGT